MLLGISMSDCRTIINLLSGLFPVRDHRIHVYHKSITDWLLNQAYQGNEKIYNESIYIIDVKKVQERICERCLDLMIKNNKLLTNDYLIPTKSIININFIIFTFRTNEVLHNSVFNFYSFSRRFTFFALRYSSK